MCSMASRERRIYRGRGCCGAVEVVTCARLLRRANGLGDDAALFRTSRRCSWWRQQGRGWSGGVALRPCLRRRSRDLVVVSGGGGPGQRVGRRRGGVLMLDSLTGGPGPACGGRAARVQGVPARHCATSTAWYQEETSIARGEEQLDMKTDVKMAVKLDMELDMKISHGRARAEREACAREKKKSRPVQNPSTGPQTGQPVPARQPSPTGRQPEEAPDNKIVNQENKNSADIITWREYEALRNEMRREFRTKDDELKGTVDEIKQTLDATNVTVTGLSDQMTDIQRNIADMRLAIENLTVLQQQQQQQEDDEDPELEDDAHNARGAPRGHRPRGWVPLGRNGRGQDEEDGLGKPKFSIPKFEGGADVEEYLTWELKIEKLWSLHPHYSEDRKIKLASSEFDGYALRWWDSLVRNLDEDGAQPIRTWRAMKEAMTSRFVPTNYMRNIFDKLTLLRQGVKTVDEYYMEMEMLMQRGRVRESLEMTMQRFLNGLKYDVKGIVRHYTYTNMNQLLHHAREAQLAEEAKVKGRATGAGRFTPRALYSAGAFDALCSLLYSA
ncbi:hypothetical protein QYE76_031560 [Lolium multiflorum]|uniref:Retrotransposon gag domain-containing protein n=1 Tax=Lolium multiflorum TaxID=4521 RepID=A0AAD8QU92_LOLMU|nr:hypothetical protein QYE76_031560 [Lolium multiflorum]